MLTFKIRKMKKLIAVLVIIVLPGMGNAQTSVTTRNVPQKVSKAFSTKYPGQQAKKWERYDSIYSAVYESSGKKYAADFSGSGAWLQTSYRIPKKLVPEAVKTAMRKSKYASWRIDRFENVQTKDNMILYRIKADNFSDAGTGDGGNPNDYTDYYNIYLLPDGKIVKAEQTHF